MFWEVTVNPQNGVGVSLDQFRMLRDGGNYYQKDEYGREIRDEGHKKHLDGHLFDEVVFEGFYRRLIIIRFAHAVPKEKQDPMLLDRFRVSTTGSFWRNDISYSKTGARSRWI